MMKLYSAPLSLFARKVEVALGEKNIVFEREMVAFTQTEGYRPKHPAVLAANPKAQVPVLVAGDLGLFDSTVILEYLEEAHPTPPLYPKGAAERARCRLLELYADEILLAPISRLMYRTEPPIADPERARVRAAEAAEAEAAIARHYGVLQEKLGANTHFCGDYSVADIALFLTVFYALRLRGPSLDGHPALAAWHARVGARPVVARIVAEIRQADRELSWPRP
jgi:glutathione S-transferase